jgi:hypothetical protein
MSHNLQTVMRDYLDFTTENLEAMDDIWCNVCMKFHCMKIVQILASHPKHKVSLPIASKFRRQSKSPLTCSACEKLHVGAAYHSSHS